MRHHRLRAELSEPKRGNAKPVSAGERIEAMQLKRLAGAVLSKSPDDLAALAETNPTIVWEWIEAFRRQKIEAEAETRYWAAAMAALSTVRPNGIRAAAE